jgi:acyl-coenzyme A thioesterase PaaI-like protein
LEKNTVNIIIVVIIMKYISYEAQNGSAKADLPNMTLKKPDRNEFREYLSRPEFRDNYVGLSGVHSELGIKITDVGEDGVTMSFLPTVSMAGSDGSNSCDLGPVATVMDSAMGMSVMLSLEEFSSIATLELRTDWIENPRANCEISVRTKVDNVVEDLVFVQAEAWQEGSEAPFCRGTARFMLTRGVGDLSKAIMGAAKAQEFPDERGSL